MYKLKKLLTLSFIISLCFQPIFAGKDRILGSQDTIQIDDTRHTRIQSISSSDVLQTNAQKQPITFINSNTGNFSVQIGDKTISLQDDVVKLLNEDTDNVGETLSKVSKNLRTLLWTMEQINDNGFFIEAPYLSLLKAAALYDKKNNDTKEYIVTFNIATSRSMNLVAKFKEASLYQLAQKCDKKNEKIRDVQSYLNSVTYGPIPPIPETTELTGNLTPQPEDIPVSPQPLPNDKPQSIQRSYMKIATILGLIASAPFIFAFTKKKFSEYKAQKKIEDKNSQNSASQQLEPQAS